jgi:hypothetical protein
LRGAGDLVTAPLSPVTAAELAEVARLHAAATLGPWRWWTSCSFRRLSSDPSGKDGDVAHARIASDGVPDISISEEDMALIERYRDLAPKMAAHLAAMQAAGAALCEDAAEVEGLTISRVRTDMLAPLRALCGDAPTDMALVPAAELARLRAPVHYAEVGHLCGAWKRGARTTTDHAFVSCGDCREHFHPDDHEQGIRQTRFGEECPACWEKLPACEEGNTVHCPAGCAEFMRAGGLFPMEPDETAAATEAA